MENNHNTLIQEILGDPSHFNSLINSHYEIIKLSYPRMIHEQIYYWASRLSLLGDTSEVRVLMDDSDEPHLATITIMNDYSS